MSHVIQWAHHWWFWAIQLGGAGIIAWAYLILDERSLRKRRARAIWRENYLAQQTASQISVIYQQAEREATRIVAEHRARRQLPGS